MTQTLQLYTLQFSYQSGEHSTVVCPSAQAVYETILAQAEKCDVPVEEVKERIDPNWIEQNALEGYFFWLDSQEDDNAASDWCWIEKIMIRITDPGLEQIAQSVTQQYDALTGQLRFCNEHCFEVEAAALRRARQELDTLQSEIAVLQHNPKSVTWESVG